jgi:hypothetical protein
LLAEGKFEIGVSVPLVLEYEAVALRLARSLGLTHSDVEAVVDRDVTRGEDVRASDAVSRKIRALLDK